MGGIVLLLWGLHMVQSGIVRAFGADLRRVLGAALRNRFKAFLAGVGVTAILQSSTATGLMASSFAASGVVDLIPALAIMLGANVGTTLIVQLLSFDIAWIAPIFLVAGYVAFRRGSRTRIRDVGRVLIGLGLMLQALWLLLHEVDVATQAPAMSAFFASITSDPILDLIVAAVLAWAAHSSVAVVLLVMSMAASQIVTPVAALALVAGANLGSAINPVLEGTSNANPASRRLPVGNLINRLAGCLLVLPLLPLLVPLLASIEDDIARQVADFHTLFNLSLAAVFILLLNPMARALERMFPDKAKGIRSEEPLYLDPAAIGTPSVALTCAAREVLRMGDLVETMLRRTMTALKTDDRKLVAEIERMDNVVDKLHEAVKFYVTAITRNSLEENDGHRAMEIVSLTINLEHVGDIIDKNLMELAAKKIKHKLKFSDEGAAELEALHQRVLGSLKLSLGVFMSGDVKIARDLLKEKTRVREAERAASEAHLVRLREGRRESIETSSLHLDILRDLKRIHSHICSAAYPVLERAGELRPSRLRETSPAEAERPATAKPHSGTR